MPAEPHTRHRWRSGVRGGRRLGLDLRPPSSMERRACRLACLQARRPLAGVALQPIFHGACHSGSYGDRPRRDARLGGWPRREMAITAPSICRTTSTNADQVPEASSRPTPSSPSPRPTVVAPSGSIAAEGARSSHGRIYRNIASSGTPSATSSNSTIDPSAIERKERLPEPPLKLARRGTPRSQSGPPRETNLCPRNRVRYTHGTKAYFES